MAPAQFHGYLARLLRGEILNRWSQLDAREVDECAEDESKLAEMLQTRYGYAKRRAEQEVRLLFRDFEDRLRMAA